MRTGAEYVHIYAPIVQRHLIRTGRALVVKDIDTI